MPHRLRPGIAVRSRFSHISVDEYLDGGAGSAAQTMHGITNKNPRENEKMIADSGTKQRMEGTVPAAPHTPPASAEKDWGPTKPITVREALRDAMAAEMRADKDVFLMGEEVAQYQGAYKISQGLLDEFGAEARDRHADHRARLHRHGGGRRDDRAEADRRVHDLQLLDAGDRPDHQFGRQDAVHVGRPAGLPDRVPRPERRGLARRRAAFAVLRVAGTRIARA